MIFADTGYFLALFAPGDELHRRATAWSRQIREPLLTTEYVVWECVNTFSKLRNRASAHALVEHVTGSAAWELVHASARHFSEGMALHRTRPDKDFHHTRTVNAPCFRSRQAVLFLAILMLNHRLLAFVGAWALAAARLAAEFAIHDGDRVVFLGDSITEQRLYTTYIEAYALTRHPDWKLTFRNVGWGGDTAWLRQRAHPDEKNLFAAEGEDLGKMVTDSVGRGLGRDVLPLKPTFVTVKFGMNDHSYQAFRPDIFRAYERSQTEIAKVLEAAGARVAFLTPQPIEDKRPDPNKDVRNESLRKFSDGLKKVAAQTGATYVDQFDPYMGLMMAERAKNPQAFIGGGDAVHPGPAGHTLMAWAVLKGLGASALVSRAEIDAGKKSLTVENCRVTGLSLGDGRVAFDRLDAALPMPIDKRAEPALKIAPVLDELSRYELRITGLPVGTYEITIDGELAARTDAETLARGYNLGNASGPVTAQARELLDAVFRKNDLYFNRWRNVQLSSFPGWANGPEIEARREAELKRLDEGIKDAENKIESVRIPRSHHFEVKPSAP